MSEPAIRIKNLTKDFRIGVRGVKLRAVDNVSLEIGDNQIFGLLGPNGCGKSTTMKILLGLLEPTKGECSIYGINSHSVKSRLNVGFLPEAPYFYKFLSGRELVRFYARVCGVPKSEISDRTEDVLTLVSMQNAAHRRVGTYSKGMLQRIGIAQAVVHDPKLIVLDEPTAGVDPIGSHAIAELIIALKERGKTVMLCSHLLAQVEGLCDRVAIMSRGKLVLEGGVDELLEKEDQRSLIIRDFNPQAQAEIEAVLAKYGSKLDKVEAPRISLDRLFLENTDGAAIGSGQDVNDKEDA
ncbi:ABC transporter ATP-binding protein [Cerasicoccus arenae]|uniref:ABC transporter ATP-binding protein n=1 Tax=Cerasicoccus arenae TaxID=424488 RepID=A0A8J3GDK1_9BACT|nr:ABC transporter ATP-binding protein [Cerasicoccus arenae]MBK1859521.1 ABC transporter ATP-binding protein [Cerasicoccus arenae]GHB97109.1 ABC transporter ATP-binding protein [Cerasicoccus arenae]